VGNGDLALATAPLHARGLFETLRAYLKCQCTAARDVLTIFLCLSGLRSLHSLLTRLREVKDLAFSTRQLSVGYMLKIAQLG
jgi:hypothetical protein